MEVTTVKAGEEYVLRALPCASLLLVLRGSTATILAHGEYGLSLTQPKLKAVISIYSFPAKRLLVLLSK